MKDRIERLQATIEEPLLVSNQVNVRYLCGLDSSNAALFVESDRVRLFTDFRYADRARAIRSVETVETRRYLYGDLAERLEGRVGFEAESLSYAQHEALAAGGIELVARRGLVEQLREVKDSAELAAVRRSAAILTEAFSRLAEEPFVGRTERDLVWRMAELMHEGGADDAAFSTAVGAGETGSSPHASPGDRRIEVGETVVVDAGCKRERLLLRLHADLRHRAAACRARGGLPGRPGRPACVARRRPARRRWQGRRSRRAGDHRGRRLRRQVRSRARSRRRAGGARSAVAPPRAGEHRSPPETSSRSSRASTSRGSAASA